MRAALEFALQRDDAAVASDLISGLWFYWLTSGFAAEAVGWVRRYLASSRKQLPPLQRLQGDAGAAEILRFTGDSNAAMELKRELVAIGRAYPDAVVHGHVTARTTAATLSDLTYMELEAGRLVEANAYGEEALALRRELGRPGGVAHALLALAAVAYAERDFLRARDLYGEAIAGFTVAESYGDILGARIAMAECELLVGRLDETAALLGAVPMLREFPDQILDVHALRVAAMLASAQEDVERCAALSGAADRKLSESGLTSLFGPLEDEIYCTFIQRARSELGDAAFDAAHAEGSQASDETILALAMPIH